MPSDGEGCKAHTLSYLVAAIVAIVALASSIFFLVESVGLLAAQPPRVTASIMSAIVGLALLSAATTISRILLLARAAERAIKSGEGGKA
jgi:hypothetical protein